MKNWIITALFILAISPVFGQGIVQLDDETSLATANFETGYTVDYRVSLVDPIAQVKELILEGSIKDDSQERLIEWNKGEGLMYVFEYRYLDPSGNWTDWRSSENSDREE